MVDASVAAKWVVEEEHSAQAALLLEWDALHAPDHWRAEAVNVLWAKVLHGDLTAAQAEERMTLLLNAPVRDTASALLMPRAFAISVACMVTIYDSLYLALAERLDTVMVTADERLIRRIATDAGLSKHMMFVGAVGA